MRMYYSNSSHGAAAIRERQLFPSALPEIRWLFESRVRANTVSICCSADGTINSTLCWSYGQGVRLHVNVRSTVACLSTIVKASFRTGSFPVQNIVKSFDSIQSHWIGLKLLIHLGNYHIHEFAASISFSSGLFELVVHRCATFRVSMWPTLTMCTWASEHVSLNTS